MKADKDRIRVTTHNYGLRLNEIQVWIDSKPDSQGWSSSEYVSLTVQEIVELRERLLTALRELELE